MEPAITHEGQLAVAGHRTLPGALCTSSQHSLVLPALGPGQLPSPGGPHSDQTLQGAFVFSFPGATPRAHSAGLELLWESASQSPPPHPQCSALRAQARSQASWVLASNLLSPWAVYVSHGASVSSPLLWG